MCFIVPNLLIISQSKLVCLKLAPFHFYLVITHQSLISFMFYRFTSRDQVFIPGWLFDVAILLSHANSAVNFFLYSWRLQAFQKELHRKILSKVAKIFSNS